jgi:hypothetical protein
VAFLASFWTLSEPCWGVSFVLLARPLALPVTPEATDNLPVPFDMSALKGLDVAEGGNILGQNGTPIGNVSLVRDLVEDIDASDQIALLVENLPVIANSLSNDGRG